MTQTLQLTRDNPLIYLKAYGGIQIIGVDKPEITCDIDLPELITMVEENGSVYVTVNTSCKMALPIRSSLQIEKGMGSVEIRSLQNQIEIEKVFGNLVLSDVTNVQIGKVGGNFSVRNASGPVRVEKVGGNLVVAHVESFSCEKIGGNCAIKNVAGEFSLYKAGGNAKAQDVKGHLRIERLGGTFTGKNVMLASDLRVGGNILVKGFSLADDDIRLKAGGDIQLEIKEDFKGGTFSFHSGGEDIKIEFADDDLEIREESYEYQIGQAEFTIEAFAGGSVLLVMLSDAEDEVVGDLSDHFVYEVFPFTEMIQERIESATRKAEAKVKSAEIRLDQIIDQVEKRRGFGFDINSDELKNEKSSESVPRHDRSVSHVSKKKGATDEERLMILKMLQEKKITVDEAETLFKALEG